MELEVPGDVVVSELVSKIAWNREPLRSRGQRRGENGMQHPYARSGSPIQLIDCRSISFVSGNVSHVFGAFENHPVRVAHQTSVGEDESCSRLIRHGGKGQLGGG